MSLPEAKPVGLPAPDVLQGAPDVLRMTKIDGLQMLRAVAVLLVTSLHSQQTSRQLLNQSTPTSFRTDNLGMFGVDIFFAISGFILTMVALRPSRDNPVRQAYQFFTRRLIRIYPVYWILLLFPILRLVHRHAFDLRSVLLSISLLPGWQFPMAVPRIDYAWTLVFEMFFYATLTACIVISPRSAPRNTAWLLALLVGLGLLTGIRHPVLILVANPILLEFVGGAALAMAYTRFQHRPRQTDQGSRGFALGWALLLAGVAYTAFLTWALPGNSSIQNNTLTGEDGWRRLATWGVAGWLLAAGTVFLSTAWSARRGGRKPLSPPARLLIFLGDASYSIYLSSAFTLEQFGRIMDRMHLSAEANGVLVGAIAVLGVLVTALFGALFHLAVERPLTGYLQHRMNSRPYSTAQLPPIRRGTLGRMS